MRTAASLRALGCSGLLAGALLLGGAALVAAQPAPPAAAASAVPAGTASRGPFILMIQLTVKPDREQDFLKLLRQMKDRVVHQDHGNIVYELFAVAPPRPPGTPGGQPGPRADQPSTQHQYVFLEEWRDQAAAAAHGKWAGPIVRTQWREMSDSMRLVPLNRVPLR